MRNELRAEFKRLITIRSSYIITLLAVAFVILFDFLTGYKTHSSAYSPNNFDTHAYIQAAFGAINVSAIFAAILAILVMAHEYRYSMIIYSLTITRRRSKVLLAKMIIVALYAAIIAIPICLIGIASFKFGVNLQHAALPPQEFNAPYILGRAMYFIVAYSLAGLLFSTLIRNLAASVATLFIVPGILESLLALLIKSKNQYLPFTSLKEVVVDPGEIPPRIHLLQTDHTLRSALTFLVYLVVGWAITWYLFVKRDAIKE